MAALHLEPETVAQYAAGLLSSEERSAADRHIDECATCRELVSALVRALSTSRPPSSTVSVAADVLPRGTKVGAYELDQPLGAGGMGLVYLASDSRLQRKVALKCVRDRHGDSSQLLREAQLMAQLAHPNVVPVYDVVEAHGLLFIAMELVTGQTLRTWLAAEPRRWEQVTDLLLEAGAGLSAAHEAGIVHGDVKPGNILVGEDGRARVTDFGLASVGSDSSTPARGTKNYLSPEQQAGAACDARSDQYAFGVTMRESLGERAPARVRRVIERALQSEPSRRYASMRALLIALRRARLGRWRFVVAGAVATVAFVVFSFAVGGQRAAAEQCEAAAAELTSPWTAQSRPATGEAFLRTGVPYAQETLERVQRTVDDWHASFEAARADACSAPLFSTARGQNRARQLDCLADQVLEAKALMAQFLDADVATVMRAVSMAQQLPSPSACLAARNEPAQGPRTENARAVNELIAKTRSIAAAGKYKDALAPALEAAKRADASGEVGLRAMAQAVLGGIYGLTGEHAKASTTLLEAVRLAEQSHEDRARALAWSDIVTMDYARGRHDAVIALSPVALGACERVDDVRLKTEVMGTLGASLSEKGRNDEAKALLEEAVRLRVLAWGENDRRTAAMLSVLANTLAMTGALDGAKAAHQKALAAAEIAFGPTHPEVAVIRQNLGDDFLYGLEAEPALIHLSRAAVNLAAAFGPKSREVAICTTDLALAQAVAGRHGDAKDTFSRAVEIWREIAADHPSLAVSLLGKYQAQLALGEPADVKDLEAAEKLSGDLPPFERGRVLLELGIATTDQKKVTEARAALDTTTLPLIAKEKARAEAWLLSHAAKR